MADARNPMLRSKQPQRQGDDRRGVSGAGRIQSRELCPFTLRLSAMLSAGLPLLQCLQALSEQTENKEFRRVISDVAQRVEAGDTFAEALQRYQRSLFGELYVSLIRAGEAGGGLAEVTAQLGRYLEASQSLRRRVKAAMTYPVVVMVMATLLTCAMLLFIVPRFKEIYGDFGARLPGPTLMLVAISDTMRHHALPVLALGIIFYFALRWFRRTEQGGYLWDRFVLRVPVAGGIIEKTALARMSRTFASLMHSGVPILRALEIVSQAAGNKLMQRALLRVSHDIEGGVALAPALKNTGIFPPMVIHMVSAGEKTGNIDGMLGKVADFYEEEVTTSLESLSSMIEPLLMAFLGVVIGGIVICMFLPIFKMHEIVAM
jgi:type IV pilus assembly protein PilC